MTSRFAGLKRASAPDATASDALSVPAPAVAPPRNARDGKKAVVGYFSPEVSKAMHQLALDHDTSLQALIGEAIDDLMRKHGKHPFGER
jgi:hypothetical protein